MDAILQTRTGDIVDRVRKLAALIASIALASGEQNGGISRISDAIAQIDSVTQQNAALVKPGGHGGRGDAAPGVRPAAGIQRVQAGRRAPALAHG